MRSIFTRRWDLTHSANSRTARSRRHCAMPMVIAMTPGINVMGPQRYRKSGICHKNTRKNNPKKSANPPIAKYAIGSRSRRLELLDATSARRGRGYFNPATSESRRCTDSGLAVLRRRDGLRAHRGPRISQGLADEHHADAGNPDQAEGDHREREGSERLREDAAEDGPDDEPGPEDDGVDPERGARDGVADDVTQVRERRGRERPGPRREDRDQRPPRDELRRVRAATGPRRERQEDREAAEAREAKGHERAAQPRPVGEPAGRGCAARSW